MAGPFFVEIPANRGFPLSRLPDGRAPTNKGARKWREFGTLRKSIAGGLSEEPPLAKVGLRRGGMPALRTYRGLSIGRSTAPRPWSRR